MGFPVFNVLDQLSRMGQKEIARSYSACLLGVLLAGGAGVITALTVAVKFLIVRAPFTLLEGAALVSANFVASFLFIQVLGFRLATKQAPLLGAALGKLLREVPAGFLHPLVAQETRWSFRTQISSALGNFAFVVPAALIFDWAYRAARDVPFLTPDGAGAILASFHPWDTPTLAFAVLTGALLWLSALAGGFIGNRLRPGSKITCSAVSNVSLGLLLALVPAAGEWLGIGIDVRHFTLSGGSATIAVASLGLDKAIEAGLLEALFGIAWIGILNFSVAFVLGFLACWLKGQFEPRSFPILRWRTGKVAL